MAEHWTEKEIAILRHCAEKYISGEMEKEDIEKIFRRRWNSIVIKMRSEKIDFSKSRIDFSAAEMFGIDLAAFGIGAEKKKKKREKS